MKEVEESRKGIDFGPVVDQGLPRSFLDLWAWSLALLGRVN